MKRQRKNWPTESNLAALKALSHTFLHFDIQPTKMSPLVVKHPFTDNGVAGIRGEDGSFSVGNLLDDPDAVSYTHLDVYKRQVMQRVIEHVVSSSSVFKCLFLDYTGFRRKPQEEKSGPRSCSKGPGAAVPLPAGA